MSYKKANTKNIASEPMVAYVTTGSSNSFYNLLGGNRVNLSNDLDIIKLARQGFSKQVLMSLAKKISLNLQELAYILHISERTLQRYDDNEII